MTDFFVICSGSTKRQVKRISDAVRKKMRESGISIRGAEGEKDAGWILLDYGDVIVHIVNQEVRDYYQIERLWKDAPLLDWESKEELPSAV